MLLFTEKVVKTMSSGMDDKTVRELCPFATTDDDGVVVHDGRSVPVRLLQWFKSPTKSEAVRMLCNDRSGAYSEIGFGEYKGGFYFYIRRTDKRRGYYSSCYRTLEGVSDDLSYLLQHIGGFSSELIEPSLQSFLKRAAVDEVGES